MTWKQTFTGRKIYALHLTVNDIDIHDIANSLAMQVRYRGHCKQFVSIAQHSVLVARCASPENRLRALLHDAHEAYSPFGDVARPDKDALRNDYPEFADFISRTEHNIDLLIAKKFGVEFPLMCPEVKELDTRILHDEHEQVMTPSEHDWNVPGQALGVEIDPWGPLLARAEFLNAFEEYGGRA